MGVFRKLWRTLAITWHKPRHWRFRPGTFDRRAFRNVVVENEYRLPPRLPAGTVVVDVGANVGTFALAVLRRGAQHVECYEPDPENFAQLQANLRPFAKQVTLHRAAVWRDDSLTQVSLHNPVGGGNTGAVQVTAAGSGPMAPVVAFDSIATRLSAGNAELWLKLDCEGAEWPILFTAARLDHFSHILGEYHLGPLPDLFAVPNGPERTPTALSARLETHGFAVTVHPNAESPHGLGLFVAIRNNAQPRLECEQTTEKARGASGQEA